MPSDMGVFKLDQMVLLRLKKGACVWDRPVQRCASEAEGSQCIEDVDLAKQAAASGIIEIEP